MGYFSKKEGETWYWGDNHPNVSLYIIMIIGSENLIPSLITDEILTTYILSFRISFYIIRLIQNCWVEGKMELPI